MTLVQLKASLALWTRREKARKLLHTAAQQDLLEARAGGVTGKALQTLIDRRDLRSRQLKEARDNVAKRLKDIEKAERNKVRRPHEKIKANVVNKSSRNGVKPAIIVIHSTESHNRPGTSDLQSIVDWFNNPSAQASSHVLVDDEGYSARCVPDSWKAWTQAAFNPPALSIEMIGFAAEASNEWTPAQYKKVAQYLAYWSKKYGIPLIKSTTFGVCRHMDLGAAGGGHHDPGVNFDLDKLLALAKSLLATGW